MYEDIKKINNFEKFFNLRAFVTCVKIKEFTETFFV